MTRCIQVAIALHAVFADHNGHVKVLKCAIAEAKAYTPTEIIEIARPSNTKPRRHIVRYGASLPLAIKCRSRKGMGNIRDHDKRHP
jgi:hypothetical protein